MEVAKSSGRAKVTGTLTVKKLGKTADEIEEAVKRVRETTVSDAYLDGTFSEDFELLCKLAELHVAKMRE